MTATDSEALYQALKELVGEYESENLHTEAHEDIIDSKAIGRNQLRAQLLRKLNEFFGIKGE